MLAWVLFTTWYYIRTSRKKKIKVRHGSLFVVGNVFSPQKDYIMMVFYVSADVSGNEWRTRYETQVELNGQLERQISLIRERLEDIRGNPVGKFSGFQKTLLWKHIHYVAVFSQVFVSNNTIPLCIVWLSFSRSRVVSSAKTLLNIWAQHFQYMKHLWWWCCSCKIGNLGGKYLFFK